MSGELNPAARELIAAGPSVVPEVLARYARSPPLLRLSHVSVLCQLGPAGEKALEDIGRDQAARDVIVALDWPGLSSGAVAVPCLRTALEPMARASLLDRQAKLGTGAARVLEILADPASGPVFLAGLEKGLAAPNDGSTMVARRICAAGAAKFSGASAIGPLTAALGDGDAGVRRAAARGLARLGAVESLRRGLDESLAREPEARAGRPADGRSAEIVLALAEAGPAGLDVLTRESEAVVPVLARAVGEANFVSSPEARPLEPPPDMEQAVRRLAAPMRDYALKGLDDRDWRARARAMDVLYVLADPKTVAAVVASLDTHPDLRVKGAQALGRIGELSSLPDLLDLMQDPSHELHRPARLAAARLGAAAIPELERILVEATSQDPVTLARRRCAVDVLCTMGEPGIDVLVRHPLEAQQGLLTSLVERGRGTPAEVLAAVRRLRPAEAMAIIENGLRSSARDDAAQTLTALANVRVDPAWNARPLDTSRAVDLLIAALPGYEESSYDSAAMEALGASGDPRALEPLVAILERHKNGAIRGEAAHALARLGDRRAVDPLISLMRSESEDPIHRTAAKESLVRLGDPRGVAAARACDVYRQPPPAELVARLGGQAAGLMAVGLIVTFAAHVGRWRAAALTLIRWCYWVGAVLLAWLVTVSTGRLLAFSISEGKPAALGVFAAYVALSLTASWGLWAVSRSTALAAETPPPRSAARVAARAFLLHGLSILLIVLLVFIGLAVLRSAARGVR